jgi:SAM-dependent methyltransferase
MGDQEAVRRLARRYSQDAPAFRRHWGPLLLGLGEQVLDGLPVEAPRAALDVGTGAGQLLVEMAGRWPTAQVVGTDRAPGMIALAPATFPRVVADARRLPFRDGSFDALTMMFMLFHVPEPWDALGEARRVLRPGGGIGVATWGEARAFEALDMWTEELDREGAFVDVPGDARDRTDSQTKLAALLEAARFDDVRAEEIPVEDTVDLEGFVERRTAIGLCRERFEAIPSERRAAFLERVRGRLESLPAEAFVDRMPAIFAWGSRR